MATTGDTMEERMSTAISEALSPLPTPMEEESGQSEEPGEAQDGIGLCLSGGGYRAMLFHVGSLWRLHEIGLLRKVDRISSVSGGSITAGVLGLKWKKIYGTDSQNSAFMDEFVTPIRKFAHVCVDINAGMTHLLPWGDTPSERVAKAYRAHLFGDATLQDLPDDPPRFVFNATDIKTGSLWRFSKPYMRDYMVGMVQNPTVKLADTVAASSAFPPFLSPAHLKSEYLKFDTPKDEPFHYPPFTTDVLLSDGGVYDNLGLETVWKRYKTVLVSDAGQKIAAEQSPSKEWLLHMIRVLDIIDNQVRSLRYRQLIASYEQKIRAGAYWGIRTKIESYRVRSLNCPYARTKELAEIPTRLTATTDNVQERLINWGYAVCDAALRAFYDQNLSPASDFPYSSTGV